MPCDAGLSEALKYLAQSLPGARQARGNTTRLGRLAVVPAEAAALRAHGASASNYSDAYYSKILAWYVEPVMRGLDQTSSGGDATLRTIVSCQRLAGMP